MGSYGDEDSMIIKPYTDFYGLTEFLQRRKMSTNRTKIDWAYKQAQRIVVQTVTSAADQRPRLVRHIAAVLRRAARRAKAGYTS